MGKYSVIISAVVVAALSWVVISSVAGNTRRSKRESKRKTPKNKSESKKGETNGEKINVPTTAETTQDDDIVEETPNHKDDQNPDEIEDKNLGKIEDENPDHNEDLDFILNGVEAIERCYGPGLMTVYGKNAFPVMAGNCDSFMRPIISAGRYGKGRFAGFTHTTCLISINESKFDNDRLLGNIAHWVSSSKQNATAGLFCVSGGDVDRFQRAFSKNGITMGNIVGGRDWHLIENETFQQQHDFLIINGHKKISDNEVEGLRKYVASGKGIILGTTPWSHTKEETPINSTRHEAFWGNKILSAMGGAAFVVESKMVPGPTLNASGALLEDTNAYQVWTDLKEILHGSRSIDEKKFKQMKIILSDRIIYAPRDTTFTNEIISEITRFVISNETNSTSIFPQIPPNGNVWPDIKKAIDANQLIPSAIVSSMTKYFEEFLSKSDDTTYSKVVTEILNEFGKIIGKRHE